MLGAEDVEKEGSSNPFEETVVEVFEVLDSCGFPEVMK